MKANTRKRKESRKVFEKLYGRQELVDRMYRIITEGKRGVDAFLLELGRSMAEAVMYMEREDRAGPDYHPKDSGIRKWASQRGSIYIADQKVPVEHPRLRGPQGEIVLESYERLRKPESFSEELLEKVLRGISCQKYAETVMETAGAFGVSAGSVSRHIITATARKLREFKERDLSGFKPFAVFVDTIFRAGVGFMVCLGLDRAGEKQVLGFWEGATENSRVCQELFSDLERRGMRLSKRIIWVSDGGSGIIKALKDRFGKHLIHQRCTIHKGRNIQRHLPKRYRAEAHRRYRTALEQKGYRDARQMLMEFERWLRQINESAADSLLEALEEILTLHRLEVPQLLRKTLHSTNPIESMFATVRDCEGNIKNFRGTGMAQRWLAAVCLHCEKGFRKVKGHGAIEWVVKRIEAVQAERDNLFEAA